MAPTGMTTASGGMGASPSAVRASAPVTTTVRTSPTATPARAPPSGQPAGPGEGVPAQGAGGHALGLEIGQLAALVAQVGDGAQEQAADGQGQAG